MDVAGSCLFLQFKYPFALWGQNVQKSEEFINFCWNDIAGFESVLPRHSFSFCATVGQAGFAGRFAGKHGLAFHNH